MKLKWNEIIMILVREGALFTGIGLSFVDNKQAFVTDDPYLV